MSLTLYTYHRSSCCQRIRIALNYKKIPYQCLYIDLSQQENKCQEFAQINPNQAIPAVILPDGSILIESMAILEYIEELYPEPPLLPKDPIQRAKIRGFSEIINSGIHPYHNYNLYQSVNKFTQGIAQVQLVNPIITAQFHALEALLTNPGKFAFGDELSFADLFLIPQITAAITRFEVDMAQFPKLTHVYNAVKDIPAFFAAQPDQQLDYK